jgi:hypothetical protein
MLEVELGGNVMEAFKTSYEMILEETRKTISAECEAKDVLKGRAELLKKLLTLKYGPLSRDVEDRLAKASLGELDLWTERILTANQIQDVFGATH